MTARVGRRLGRWAAILALLVLGVSHTAGAARAAGLTTDTSYRVVPILFLPADHPTPDEFALDRADSLVEEARQWYLQTLGRTFYAVRARVVHAWWPAARYTSPYEQILDELDDRGEIPYHSKLLVYIPPSIRQDECCSIRFRLEDGGIEDEDGGPYEAGEHSEGYVLQTEDFSDPALDVRGSRHRDHAVGGGIIHELGHTFSLPHPYECENVPRGRRRPEFCQTTPMWGWQNYPGGDPADPSAGYGWLNTARYPEAATLHSSAYMWNTSCSVIDPVPACLHVR